MTIQILSKFIRQNIDFITSKFTETRWILKLKLSEHKFKRFTASFSRDVATQFTTQTASLSIFLIWMLNDFKRHEVIS